MTTRVRCQRCGGFDPRCPQCAARRLARKHGGALDAAGPRLDETEQDDPAGAVERFYIEGDAGVLAGLPKARP